ncbi:MAG: hypothetical protein M1828_003220 [Chrysothrix sp. TS-e1954]|nr:MAG: hypothetical protein M1828_003220 [Chrysothrix sp. TS-e1954]
MATSTILDPHTIDQSSRLLASQIEDTWNDLGFGNSCSTCDSDSTRSTSSSGNSYSREASMSSHTGQSVASERSYRKRKSPIQVGDDGSSEGKSFKRRSINSTSSSTDPSTSATSPSTHSQNGEEGTAINGAAKTKSSKSTKTSQNLDDVENEKKLKEELPKVLPELLAEHFTSHEPPEVLRAGAANLVFSFSAVSHKTTNREYVIRVPMHEGWSYNESTEVQATVLKFLRSQSALAPFIPEVFAFDNTTNNAIGRPYIIQERMPGESTVDFIDDFTESQDKRFAERIADLMLDMEKTTFPCAGELTTLPVEGGLRTSEVVVVDWHDTDCQDVNTPTRPTHESLYEMLSSRIHEAISKTPRLQKGLLRDWRTLLAMLNDMESLGWFEEYDSEYPIVLRHSDLYPRNIMGKPPVDDEDTDIKLTAVVDWDQTTAVHRVLARRPPHFLWEPLDDMLRGCWQEDSDFYSKEELYPEENVGYSVKAHFDYYMTKRSPSWKDEAYGRGRWLRRIAKLALSDLDSPTESKAFCWVHEQWIMYLYRLQHGMDENGNFIEPTAGKKTEARKLPSEDNTECSEQPSVIFSVTSSLLRKISSWRGSSRSLVKMGAAAKCKGRGAYDAGVKAFKRRSASRKTNRGYGIKEKLVMGNPLVPCAFH